MRAQIGADRRKRRRGSCGSRHPKTRISRSLPKTRISRIPADLPQTWIDAHRRGTEVARRLFGRHPLQQPARSGAEWKSGKEAADVRAFDHVQPFKADAERDWYRRGSEHGLGGAGCRRSAAGSKNPRAQRSDSTRSIEPEATPAHRHLHVRDPERPLRTLMTQQGGRLICCKGRQRACTSVQTEGREHQRAEPEQRT